METLYESHQYSHSTLAVTLSQNLFSPCSLLFSLSILMRRICSWIALCHRALTAVLFGNLPVLTPWPIEPCSTWPLSVFSSNTSDSSAISTVREKRHLSVILQTIPALLRYWKRWYISQTLKHLKQKRGVETDFRQITIINIRNLLQSEISCPFLNCS